MSWSFETFKIDDIAAAGAVYRREKTVTKIERHDGPLSAGQLIIVDDTAYVVMEDSRIDEGRASASVGVYGGPAKSTVPHISKAKDQGGKS